MRHAHDHQHFLVSDYLKWPDELRCELIDGVVYDMSPAPTISHQTTVKQLTIALDQALRSRRKGEGGGDGCELFVSPIDVVLSENSVVQPDVVVVCDLTKTQNGRYIDGAPDLVIEVLSPSTAAKDMKQKRDLYQRAGVGEYLLIHPTDHMAWYYHLDDQGRYGEATIWSVQDELHLALLPEYSPTLQELFEWPPEDPTPISRPLERQESAD